MDIDKAIAATEKYLREFILYIVSFFWREGGGSDDERVFEDVNRHVIFSLLSTFVGAYLWHRYVLKLTGRNEDVAGLLADSLLRWLTLGLLLYGLMRMVAVRAHILLPIVSVLKVFSVAHVLAIYAAYVAMKTVQAFMRPGDFAAIGQGWTVTAAYGIELAMLLAYFPGEIASIVPAGTARWRVNVVRVLFLLVVAIVVLLPYAQYKCGVQQCG